METTQNVALETNDAQEYRRLLAWRMYGQGYPQKDMAQTLQVTQGAISQWVKRGKEKGAQSLCKRKASGPPSRLTQEQFRNLPDLLQQGAEAYGFWGAVWTRERVAKVIAQELGVVYSHAHISKILKKIGGTQQKPARRALQRQEEAIARWKHQTLPALKKGRSEKAEPGCMERRAASICGPL